MVGQHTESRQVDWERVEAWAAALRAGDTTPLQPVFARDGGDVPRIVWGLGEPPRAPQLRFLYDYYRDLACGPGFPSQRRVDPLGMRPALGYVMLLDPVDGGRDFRYRLYGSFIAGVSGRDMTGKLVSTYPVELATVEYMLALYRAVLTRKMPVMAVHRPLGARTTKAWHRLILPLGDEAGGVGRLLVGAVPIGFDDRAQTHS